MVEFMVIAAPRSGTTWAANWLTTDTSLCLHDPLFQRHYSDLDSIKTDKMLGISCTGIALFQDFVQNHPARKLILHRDTAEVNKSLADIGLPPIDGAEWDGLLSSIKGFHVHWESLFTDPRPIYEYLLQKELDAERHALLREMQIQPNFDEVKVDRNATRKLIEEMRKAIA